MVRSGPSRLHLPNKCSALARITGSNLQGLPLVVAQLVVIVVVVLVVVALVVYGRQPFDCAATDGEQQPLFIDTNSVISVIAGNCLPSHTIDTGRF